jgi:glycerate-2-kinase
MIIKNFKSLATTETRKHALEIINAGIEAVLIAPSIRKQISLQKGILKIQNTKWNLSKYQNVYVVGAGKAASDSAFEIEKILGKRITSGLVIDTKSRILKKIKVVKGTHPLPSEVNVKATHQIIDILKSSTSSDLVINLISGGGSALLCAPRIDLDKQIEVSKLLLKRGATIQEINTIRKHISYIKGGQMASYTKAQIITLIVSDVLTNDIQVIASGPTARDSTTSADARRIQTKYRLPKLDFVETPKEKPSNVTNILLITNISSVNAMKHKAQSLGYKTRILSTQLKGEARDVGKKLAQSIKKGQAIIAAGETTVTVKGHGKGGRNQELVLGALEYIKKGAIIGCSTDGVDFITEAAGGIADEQTKEHARKSNLRTSLFLKNNDSYNFLRKVNGIISTGKTGTNVADLMIALGDE